MNFVLILKENIYNKNYHCNNENARPPLFIVPCCGWYSIPSVHFIAFFFMFWVTVPVAGYILSFNFIFFLFSFLWHFSLQTFVQILKRFICGFCDHEQHSSILFSRLTSLLIFWCGIVLQHKNMKFESSRFHHLYRALVLFDILLFLSIVRFTSKPHLFILVTDYTIIEGRVFNCLHDTVLMMLSQFCFSQIKTYCTQLENYMCG